MITYINNFHVLVISQNKTPFTTLKKRIKEFHFNKMHF